MNERGTVEQKRYDRQIRLPEVGLEGQEKLRQARVLLIGMGGLGSPAALYLAAAGVGTLGLADADQISESNLQRQILYATHEEGLKKVDRARVRLQALNPLIEVRTHPYQVDADNILSLIEAYDLVLDGTDSFQSRALISHACVSANKPHLYGGIFRFEGQVSLFSGHGDPCYRCLYPELPESGEVPNCGESGVLGPVAGIVGSVQALEALKHILQLPESLPGQLWVMDSLFLENRTLQIAPRSDCPVCGPRKQSFRADLYQSLSDYQLRIGQAYPRLSILIDVRNEDEVNANPVKQALHIPLVQLKLRSSELDPNQNYVLICQSGQRSREAQEILFRKGFRSVWNLAGGLNEWEKSL